MSFKARLLLIFLPLLIIPCVLVFVLNVSMLQTVMAFRVTDSYMIILVVGMTAVLVAATIFAIFMSHAISDPLQRLTRQASAIAAGHLEVSPGTQVESDTAEITQLAEAISQMRCEIRRQQVQIREDAEHAAIGKLASHVVHDLAGPLSSMTAVTELLRDKLMKDPDGADALNLLQLSSQRLSCIAKGLLDRKREGPRHSIFPLHAVLDELLGEYQMQSRYRGVKFVKQYNAPAVTIQGKRIDIQRVFGNIIKNALEAMDGLGSLIVRTDRDEDRAVIMIQDNGPGMSSDLAAKILSGGVSSGKKEGHGIGMSVVHKVIADHHGTIDLTTAPGVGSTFTIDLPLLQISDDAPKETEADVLETLQLSVPSGRVIVVDDDESISEQWLITLRALNLNVTRYASWEKLDAACHPEAQPKDLETTFIVDYHFDNSEVDGLEIIRRLKKKGCSNLVLATAEYWKPAIKDASKQLGIIICPKPLPKVVLVTAVIANPAWVKQSSDKAITVLLIDDDPSIRKSWEMMQKILGIGQLSVFSRLEDVMDAAINPSEYDLCVIDKNIEGSDYNGARMLRYLKQNGARRVFLATGEQGESIQNDPDYAAIDGILSEKVPMSLDKYLSS